MGGARGCRHSEVLFTQEATSDGAERQQLDVVGVTELLHPVVRPPIQQRVLHLHTIWPWSPRARTCDSDGAPTMETDLVSGNDNAAIQKLLHAGHVHVGDAEVADTTSRDVLHQELRCRHVVAHAVVVPIELHQINSRHREVLQRPRNPLQK